MLLVASDARAQGATPSTAVQSIDSLWSRVKSGDTVIVTDSAARETTGVLAGLSDSNLTMLVEGACATSQWATSGRSRNEATTRSGMVS